MAAIRRIYTRMLLCYLMLCLPFVWVTVYVFSQHKTSTEKLSNKKMDNIYAAINVNHSSSNRQDDTFLSGWSLQDGNSERFSVANASEVGLDVGRTEWEQYQKFVKMDARAPRRTTMLGYSYRVELIGNRPTTQGLFVRIEERYQNRTTKGGSTFVITSDGYGQLLCPYRDMFNGTYFAWCPPIVTGQRRAITVVLQFVDFRAFTIARLQSIKYVIGHHSVRLDRFPKVPEPLNMPEITSVLKNYMNKKDVVEWFEENGSWIVQLASGQRFITLETHEMCRCIKRMKRVVMIGASHIRYVFDYIAEQCYNRKKTGFFYLSHAAIENLVYLVGNYNNEFDRLTRRRIFGITLRKDDVIFTQWGTHPLVKPGLKHTLDPAIKKQVKALVALRKKAGVPASNFVVVTQPPLPYHETGLGYNGNRNSACVAVVTRQFKSLLAVHNFNVFDQFSILRPQQEQDVCFGHYMCRTFNGKHTRVYGGVGIHVAKLMMAHVCR